MLDRNVGVKDCNIGFVCKDGKRLCCVRVEMDFKLIDLITELSPFNSLDGSQEDGLLKPF